MGSCAGCGDSKRKGTGNPDLGAYGVGNEGAGNDPRVSRGLCRQAAVAARAAGGGWNQV